MLTDARACEEKYVLNAFEQMAEDDDVEFRLKMAIAAGITHAICTSAQLFYLE